MPIKPYKHEIMGVKIPYLEVSCDICQIVFYSPEGKTGFTSEYAASDALHQSECWVKENENIYCGACNSKPKRERIYQKKKRKNELLKAEGKPTEMLFW